MLTARRDSDPGASAVVMTTCWPAGVAILTGPNARGRRVQKSMNPTFSDRVKIVASDGTLRVVCRTLLPLETPSAAGISQKVPKSRKFAL